MPTSSDSFGGGSVSGKLRADLLSYIKASPPHTPLASAQKIATERGVGIMTARRVLAKLVEDGWLYAHKRRGYYVAERVEESPVRTTIVYTDRWEDLQRAYRLRLLQGVLETADACGYKIEIVPYSNDTLEEATAASNVSGLITPHVWDRHAQFQKRNPSLCVVGIESPLLERRENCASVTIDFHAAGFLALRSLPHGPRLKTIACVSHVSEFWAGALDCQREAFPEIGLTSVFYEKEMPVLDQVAHLTDAKPDALVFDDDRYALAVLEALKVRGVPCPALSRIAVATSRDEAAQLGGVIRIETDSYELGAEAVRLLDAMRKHAWQAGRSIQLLPVVKHPE